MKLVKTEKKSNYKSLSDIILFYDEDNIRSHEFIFSKNVVRSIKCVTILLEDLVTSKTNIDNANVDQRSFIINLKAHCEVRYNFWQVKAL